MNETSPLKERADFLLARVQACIKDANELVRDIPRDLPEELLCLRVAAQHLVDAENELASMVDFWPNPITSPMRGK